jgi:hypothetical protein
VMVEGQVCAETMERLASTHRNNSDVTSEKRGGRGALRRRSTQTESATGGPSVWRRRRRKT